MFSPATDPFEARAGASFYSDDPTLEVQVISGQPDQAPKPLSDIPEPADGEEPVFLTRDDKWFAELRNVRFHSFDTAVNSHLEHADDLDWSLNHQYYTNLRYHQ